MHMIMTDDRGAVAGYVKPEDTTVTPTWHGHPAYEVLESYNVPESTAAEIFSTKFSKVQSYTPDMQPIPGAFHIVNEKGHIVAPHVGNQFVATDRTALWNFISEHFLALFPDLNIESVGTLINTRIAFVNFKINEFTIKGDASPTVNRLLLYDPIGLGSLHACDNQIRVVCFNTLTAASKQGTSFKISHTASATHRIESALELIAESKLNLKKLETDLNELALIDTDAEYVDAFLNNMFPIRKIKDEESKRGAALSAKRREAVLAVFENDQQMTAKVGKSRYGLLNAFTNVMTNAKMGKKMDAMAIEWDNLCGNRAEIKQRALAYLGA